MKAIEGEYAIMSSKTFGCDYSNVEPYKVKIFRSYFNQIKKARTNILKYESFAGSVSMNVDFIIANKYKGIEIPTACTDGNVIIISPNLMEEKFFIEIQATIEHESWHIGLLHPFRAKGRNHKLCNIAADYSVNGLMLARYPDIVKWGWLYDEKFSKMSMEAVYEILKKKKKKGGGRSREGNGEEKSKGDGGCEGEGEGEGEGEEKNDSDNWKNAEHGQFIEATNDDGSPLSKDQFNKSLEEHKEFISITKSISKSCGFESGGERDRHIDKVISPKINWEVLISRFVSKHGRRIGMNPMKFSRQKIKHGIYYPDDIKSGDVNLGMGFDVSSSMDKDSLDLLASCMENIRRRNNIKTITILPFNTRVIKNSIKIVKKGEKIPKTFSGWGGTRFSPVFNWFNEQKKKPDMVIIFTDLGSSDYGKKPDYPVMWASSYPVVSYTSYTNKPPFGNVVEIEPRQT